MNIHQCKWPTFDPMVVIDNEINLVVQVNGKKKALINTIADKKEDQIRAMAWFALWCMLLYPVTILVTSLIGQETAAQLVSDIAPTYFVAIAGLVAAFFGAQAYSKGKAPEAKK